MYIVMFIEQHVRSFAFVKSERDIAEAGRNLLNLRGVITPIIMTGKEPGVNNYGEPNRIMYADVFEIRAAEIRPDWTYNIMDY